MQINGIVLNPVTSSFGDGSNPVLAQGRQGDLLASELHGKWYTAGYRGKTFIAASATAGVIIPVNAATLVSVFSLWNPAGSGVNAELIDLDIFMTVATQVVAGIGLFYQAGVGSAIAVPGTLTKATPVGMPIGATPGGNAVQFYTALTHVGTPSILKWVAGFQATASGALGSHTEFDGKIIIPPGVVISLAGFAAQTGAADVSLSWAEHLA